MFGVWEYLFLALQKILQLHKPQLLFLCETKLMPVQMNQISRKLKFENYFGVDRSGKIGGLAILWNPEIEVQIKSFSKHHIDAEM